MSINCKNVKELFITLSICVIVINSHPIVKNEAIVKDGLKLEQHLPNGTVVGGYNYTDKNGNPVAIKYFADDNSYGIEFKSVKVTGIKPQSKKIAFLDNRDLLDTDIDSDLEAIKQESTPASDLTMDLAKKDVYTKGTSTSPDYEIFSQNEITNPKKCNNEKVRVYYNTDRRRYAREIEQDDELTKFCEQVK